MVVRTSSGCRLLDRAMMKIRILMGVKTRRRRMEMEMTRVKGNRTG